MWKMFKASNGQVELQLRVVCDEGSSREEHVWDTAPDAHIAGAILSRCKLYLPLLARVDAVRVGLRPCAAQGLPLIGPIPGFQGDTQSELVMVEAVYIF